MYTRSFVAASALLLATLGCRDEIGVPTEPAPASPQASVTATALGSWISRASYPFDIWNATSASITNPSTLRSTVYVIGGGPNLGSIGNITSAVKAYDVSANVWRSKATYPVRVRTTNGAVAINGRIYVSGGFTRLWNEQLGKWVLQTLKALYVYNPATDKWTRRHDMPTAAAGGLSAAYKGMLYVAAPCSELACGLRRYNPSTDRWVVLSHTPHDPWKAGGGFVGGKLYLFGWEGATDIYDPATNSWSAGPDIPMGGCQPASATLQGKFYLVGCFDDENHLVTLVFDPTLGSWSQAASPQLGAYGGAATLSRVMVNGRPRLELVGGVRPGNNWQYVP